MTEFKCKRCVKEFDNYSSLRKHTSRVHKIHGTTFYVEFYLNGIWPVCGCGCGEKTKWSYTNKRFREFSAVGHLMRVRNNWGHNQKAIDASAETRRKQYASGERHGWCEGLSIETDERIRRLAQKTKDSINSNSAELKRRSESMSKMRKGGTIPTLYREKSSQWKGGVSSIQQIARSDKRLYDVWKYPILVGSGFKCCKCPNTKNLHVHHNDISFSEIIKKVMTIDDYERIDDFEVKKDVTRRVIDYHIENRVSGEVLCRDCHGKIHPSLNFV